jgi:hypothetical protein
LGWLSSFLITLYIYFHDFQKPHIASNPIESLALHFQAFSFFIAFLGSPLGFRNLLISQAIGLILLLIFIAICFYLISSRSDFTLIQRSIGW